jgi:uncharacterized protein
MNIAARRPRVVRPSDHHDRLAGRSGGLLVPATLATASGIPRTTLNRYLELLSAVFLIKQIPAWSAGQTQRAIGMPKLAFVDPGIASHLLGQDATRRGEPDGAAGPQIETFVLIELFHRPGRPHPNCPRFFSDPRSS